MTYTATAIEVMLASPGDVKDERVIARKVIAQWNAEHSREFRAVLLTMGWETHSGSDVQGKRAQALINERLVAHADLMIGIFWTRLGTPTGRANSGTVEEIKLHHKNGKPLMLYFSDAPVPPSKIDQTQYSAVQTLRQWAFKQGYVGSFSGKDEFHETFRRDLTLMLKDNESMRKLILPVAENPAAPDLTKAASELLKIIGAASNGQLIIQKQDGVVRYFDGETLKIEASATMDILKWRAGLDELLSRGLLIDKTGRDQLFELTAKSSALLSS